MPSRSCRGAPRSIVLGAALCALALAAPASSVDAQGGPAACVVSGPVVDLDAVRVTPRGAASFTLVERGLRVEATPGPDGGAVPVRIRGVLDLRGSATRVPYRMATRTSAAGGILSLSTDTDVLRVRSRSGHVVVDVAIGWGDAQVHGLRLACAALALGHNGAPSAVPGSVRVGDGTAWAPKGHALTFHTGPGTGARLSVAFTRSVSLVRLARRGFWYQLRYTGPDQSTIEGWVARSALVSTGFGTTGGARDYGGPGTCGRGRAGGPNVRFGPASVDVGTPVLASRGQGAWATVATDARVTAMRVGDDPWTRIVYAPGLSEGDVCGELTHAWVQSDAVHFVTPPTPTAAP